MGYRGARRNDQVEAHHYRRSVHERIRSAVECLAEILNDLGRNTRELLGPLILLQADEPYARETGESEEVLQRGRTALVRLRSRISLPGDAHASP